MSLALVRAVGYSSAGKERPGESQPARASGEADHRHDGNLGSEPTSTDGCADCGLADSVARRAGENGIGAMLQRQNAGREVRDRDGDRIHVREPDGDGPHRGTQSAETLSYRPAEHHDQAEEHGESKDRPELEWIAKGFLMSARVAARR